VNYETFDEDTGIRTQTGAEYEISYEDGAEPVDYNNWRPSESDVAEETGVFINYEWGGQSAETYDIYNVDGVFVAVSEWGWSEPVTFQTLDAGHDDMAGAMPGEGQIDDQSGSEEGSEGWVRDWSGVPDVTGGTISETATRSWEYRFDEDWTMLGGTETENGIVTEYGRNWKQLDSYISADANIVTTEYGADNPAPDWIPASLFTTNDDGLTVSHAITTNFDWGGSEVIYLDGDQNILGYQFNWFDDSNGNYGGHFEDGDRNWLGHYNYNNGDEWWDGGFDSNSEVVDEDAGTRTQSGVRYDFQKDADGEFILDDSGQKVLEETPSEQWTYVYDYEDWSLISGTEIRNGEVTEFGEGWQVISRTLADFNADDLKVLASEEPLLRFLPDQFVYEDEDEEVGTYVIAKFEEGWDPNNSRATFYDEETGAVLGYADVWDNKYNQSVHLNDANWNYLGSVWADNYRLNVNSEV